MRRPLMQARASSVAAVFLLNAAQPCFAAQTPDPLRDASIVFVGTVTEVAASSVKAVPASPRTIVTRVEVVVKKPANVSLAKGASVTIAMKEGARLATGTRATFYCQGWIFGEGLALRELKHELTPATAEGGALAAERRLADKATMLLKDRVDAADAVVVGRVVEVRPAVPLTAAAGGSPAPVTEHAAQWKEAVIRVESALKGVQTQNVVVRFPGSMDVAWYGVPKLKKDQEGTFLLKKDDVTGVPKPLTLEPGADTYVALHNADVLPKAEADKIRALLPPR
jgi:hypothetical protein